MKILFVATVDIHIINHHLRIIHKLHQMGYQVDVAANGSFSNADIHRKYNVCFSKNPTSFDNIRAYYIIRRLMREGSYDVVSCHTPLASFYTRLAARGLTSRVIYTAHGFHFYQGCPLVNRTVYKAMEAWAAHYTDILVTINHEDYEAAQSFHLKPGGRAVLIPGVGVNVAEMQAMPGSREKFRQQFHLAPDDYVLMSIGELNANKDHLFVIQSLQKDFQQDRHLQYVICGSGPLKQKIQQYLRENNLQKQVHLLGYREDAVSLLRMADLFVFPSHREGLPVSLMEAMAMGVPIIASQTRGNRDLITDHVNGMLFSLGNAQQLRQEAAELREHPNLAEQFIAVGRKQVLEYDAAKVDPQILALYSPIKNLSE